MNTVLKAETITDDQEKVMDQVIDILVANGYNAAETLKPVTKGYNFFYIPEYKCIALVNEKSEVVFPKEVAYNAETAISFEGCGKYIDVLANDVDAVKQAIVGGSEKITLSGETMEFNFAAQVVAGNKTSVDLGNVILSTSQNASDSSKHYYGFDVWGTLELNNGTINARGVETMAAGAKITIGENMTINAIDKNGGACIWNVAGAEVVVNGGTFTAVGNYNFDTEKDPDANGLDTGVISNEGTLVINGGSFTSKDSNTYAIINKTGTTTIYGGEFSADRGIISALAGTVTINGGTFTAGGVHGGHVVYADNGHVVINGGTFTGTYAIENGGTGSITFKAGVVLNGETLANDLVIGTPVTE